MNIRYVFIEKNKYIVSEWKYTVIATLLIFIIILFIELNKKKKTINNNDIKTLLNLLEIFNIEDFEEEIAKQFSYYGYPKSTIKNLIRFLEESKKIKNTFQDKQLDKLMKELSKKTGEFLDYASLKMYDEDYNYEIPIELKRTDPEKRVEIGEKIDIYAQNIYEVLQELIKYMKKNDIDFE